MNRTFGLSICLLSMTMYSQIHEVVFRGYNYIDRIRPNYIPNEPTFGYYINGTNHDMPSIHPVKITS
jgi:hypothetical protein